MNKPGLSYKDIQQGSVLLPQEEMLEVGRKSTKITIGVPRETSFQENRVPLIPSAVSFLTACGHQVLIQADAGKHAHFQDKDYAEAGARIVYSAKEVYQADIVLKISPPTQEEIDCIRPRQLLLSAVQSTTQYGDVIRQLMAKKATALAFNYLRDDEGAFPVVRSMGEIAGSTAMLIAAEYLSNANQGKGLMLGGVTGIPPVEVLIIGAGIVGESAARTALGLGASVKVFDSSLSRLARMQHLVGGHHIFTSLLQPDELARRMQSADVVIGALRAAHGRTPCVVTEQMVSEMKYGSVLIDVSIDQGGCFETSRLTSHDQPTFKKYGVIHYCVPNIASRVAHTASTAMSNIFAPMLASMGEEGGPDQYFRNHPAARSGVYLYQGMVTNEFFAKIYRLPYKDIDLIMAAL